MAQILGNPVVNKHSGIMNFSTPTLPWLCNNAILVTPKLWSGVKFKFLGQLWRHLDGILSKKLGEPWHFVPESANLGIIFGLIFLQGGTHNSR